MLLYFKVSQNNDESRGPAETQENALILIFCITFNYANCVFSSQQSLTRIQIAYQPSLFLTSTTVKRLDQCEM